MPMLLAKHTNNIFYLAGRTWAPLVFFYCTVISIEENYSGLAKGSWQMIDSSS